MTFPLSASCFCYLKTFHPLWLLIRRHYLEMEARHRMRAEIRRRSRGRRAEYPPIARNEQFSEWFPAAVQRDVAAGTQVDEDVLGLVLPPSCEAKSYRSMYAYGNHIRVRGAEVHLSTCDSGVAATFSQSCRASRKDKNHMLANVEYVGWVEEIIGADYGKFELLLLYCKWVQATWIGPRATMKRDEYGFTLVNIDRTIPYSSDSFAFPLHAQQVFFVDDVAHPGWKVVLCNQSRSVRVTSMAEGRPDLHCLSLRDDAEIQGLMAQNVTDDTAAMPPVLSSSRELSSNEVQLALQMEDTEADYNDESPQ